MHIQAKVALDKQKHPERFCPVYRCLWKTAKLNHATQQHEGGGYCPRHAAYEEQMEKAKIETANALKGRAQ